MRLKFYSLLFFLIGQCFFTFGELYAVDKIQIVKSINWNAPDYIKKAYQFFFTDLKHQAYDPLLFKVKLDQVNKEIIASGYFDSIVRSEIQTISPGEVAIVLEFKAGARTNLYFYGNKLFSFQELRNKEIEKIKNEFGKVDIEQLKTLIVEMYEELGVYNTNVDITTSQGLDLDKVKVKNLIVNITEGQKIKLSKISFRGLNYLTSESLLNVYLNNATPLSRENFYDKVYLDNFTNIIKKTYFANGFVYAEVSRPRIVSEPGEEIEIEYFVNEKSQVFLRDILLDKLPDDLGNEIKGLMINKEGSPINIVAIETDLKNIINHLQSKGYYFSSISNLNSDSLLKYEKSSSAVDFYPKINLDNKICYNEIILNGNYKTDAIVISREVDFQKGDLITPNRLDLIKQKISGLGLFSNMKITPYMIYDDIKENDCAKTNLIIQVKERDFRSIEFTPGYRTDIGGKAALGISYNNLGGMNRSVTFKTQGNLRTNLDSLDDRRRIEDKNLFEYSGKITFVEPYLFYNLLNDQVEFEITSSIQRKRFNSFDADIMRISPQLAKNITKKISTSVKYQLEKILQFDATETKDNDNFRIGSITPSITLDFRDDQINPHKGTYFNLTSEWANHYFGSMKQADFEVNYLKITSRNKFYYPLGNFILATSLSGGFEQNYATGFFIPSIKVFRLDGYDEIRGFEDNEINRLSTGTSISSVEVTNKAYFLAFKFEPRYNLSDAMQLNVFFDSGRVFVDNFKPLDLRTSIGLGLKFLTPIGSLDFDYGFKLKRASYPDGKKDATGRFHLSIGFF